MMPRKSSLFVAKVSASSSNIVGRAISMVRNSGAGEMFATWSARGTMRDSTSNIVVLPHRFSGLVRNNRGDVCDASAACAWTVHNAAASAV